MAEKDGREMAMTQEAASERTINDIIVAIKENERPDYEDLRLTCLALNSLLFFAHGDIKRLLKGGIAAELTRRDYPGAHAELGISQNEYKALKMEPEKYLGAPNIPGTTEYEARYRLSKKIFEKFTKGSEQ